MKKILTIFLAVCLAATAVVTLTACEGENDDKRLKIVATIFPEYDWVVNVLGDDKDDYKLTLLLDSGADLHSYQPTVADMATIAVCDLFIYVGGESDGWVDGAMRNATNKNMKTINLLEVLGDNAKEEEHVEGMEEHEHEHEDEHDEEETEYDEHVWLSLKNAQLFITEIEKALSSLDAERAGKFKANAASYNAKLAALDEEYVAATNNATNKTLLFADRFPFRYLADDYGLSYYAAFSGCSAETEASFDTIIFLAGKVDELGLNYIFTTESSDGKIARTVKENTANKNQTILKLDSLQSATTATSVFTFLSISLRSISRWMILACLA